MIMIDDLPQVEREYDELKDRISRAKGREEEGMARIRKDFGPKDLDHAEQLLDQKKLERQEAATRWLRAFKKFKKELARVKGKIDEPA